MKKLFTFLIISVMSAVLFPGLADAANWSDRTVMLDPGHGTGGGDPGALSPGSLGNPKPHEAELCMRAANATRNRLIQLGIGECRLTRWDDNSCPSLSARAAASGAMDPWAFISIHLNSATETAHGTETFYHWTTGNSPKLATCVNNRLVSELGTSNRRCMQDNAYYGYALGVLANSGQNSGIPGILTEALFVCNPNEWRRINEESKEGFVKWVNGFVYGLYDYFMTAHGVTGFTDPTVPQADITVNSGDIHWDCVKGDQPYKDIEIKGNGLSENISVWSSDANEVEVSPTSLPASGGWVRITMKATGWTGWREQRVYFKSGNIQKEIKVTANVTGPSIDSLEEGWNISERRGNATNYGYDARNFRNFTYKDGKLYCVYNHSEIIVLKAQTGEYLGKLKTGACDYGTLNLCDVKAHNGKIYACNLANGDEWLRVYCWDTDESEPYRVIDTNDKQGCSRLGDNMDITGTVGEDGWFGFGWDNGSSEFRIVEYHSTASGIEPKYTLGCNGSGGYVKVGANPRVYIWGNGNYWIDGNAINPLYLAAAGNGKANCAAVNHYDGHTQGSSHHEFYFNGKKYCAHFICTGDNYSNGQMRMFHDAAGDFSNNQNIKFYPSDGLGSGRNANGTGEVIINTDGENYVEAWVMSTTQGLAYYKFGQVPAINPGKVNPPTVWFDKRDSSLKTVAGSTAQHTLYLDGKNLQGGIDITIAGPGVANFTLETTHLDGPGNVNLTYHPTDWSHDWVWLGATPAGGETAWTDIHGSCFKNPTVEVSGDLNFHARVGESAWQTYTVHADNLQGTVDAGLWGGSDDQYTLTHPFAVASEMTIYFNNLHEWVKPNIWVWDITTGENYTGGTWPGQNMTWDEGKQMLKFTFNPQDLTHQYGVVFTDEQQVNRTEDATIVNGAVYTPCGHVAERYPHAIPVRVTVDAQMTVQFHPTLAGEIGSNFFIATTNMSPNCDRALNGTAQNQPWVNFDGSGYSSEGLWAYVNEQGSNHVWLNVGDLKGEVNVWLEGDHADQFNIIAPSDKWTSGWVDIYHNPTWPGTHYATIVASTEGASARFDISAGSEYRPQSIVADRTEHWFGEVGVGRSGMTTINIGGNYLREDIGLSLHGDHSSHFRLGTDRVYGSGNVDVYYEPLDLGNHSAVLKAALPSGESKVEISLNGTGIDVSGVKDVVADGDFGLMRAGGKLTVRGIDAARIEIYNVAGGLMAFVENSNEIDVLPLQAGVYIVAVTDGDGLRHHRKVEI